MIALLATITAIVYMAVTPHAGERFTEFYILGLEGKAEGYPREVRAGEAASVILGIINREHAVVTYRIVVSIDGTKNSEISPVSIIPEEKWEQVIKFIPTMVGDNQTVEFLLYKDAGVSPYLSLNLWLDVK